MTAVGRWVGGCGVVESLPRRRSSSSLVDRRGEVGGGGHRAVVAHAFMHSCMHAFILSVCLSRGDGPPLAFVRAAVRRPTDRASASFSSSRPPRPLPRPRNERRRRRRRRHHIILIIPHPRCRHSRRRPTDVASIGLVPPSFSRESSSVARRNARTRERDERRRDDDRWNDDARTSSSSSPVVTSRSTGEEIFDLI